MQGVGRGSDELTRLPLTTVIPLRNPSIRADDGSAHRVGDHGAVLEISEAKKARELR